MYAVPRMCPSVPASRPIMESSANTYRRVMRSPAVMAGVVAGPAYLSGSVAGAPLTPASADGCPEAQAERSAAAASAARPVVERGIVTLGAERGERTDRASL